MVAAAQRGRRREGTFFTAMAVSLAAVVFVGFSRSFFLRPWFPETAQSSPPEAIFYVHGVLFAAWMVLLIAQTVLVSARRIQLHRAMGVVGVVLAAAMVVIGTLGSMVAAGRPSGFIGVTMPPLQFLVSPVFDMILFGLFVGLAAIWRRNSQSHKRLMLLATVNLLEAAIIRIPLPIMVSGGPLINFWLADIFIVLLVIWDVSSLGRLHAVTLWAGLLTVVSQPLRFWIGGTDSWVSFAGWAVGLLD